jgi:hypothetical protein
MAETRAKAFAKMALSVYAHEGTFHVDFRTAEECHEAAAAFRELGCAVAPIEGMLRLAIICPPSDS